MPVADNQRLIGDGITGSLIASRHIGAVAAADRPIVHPFVEDQVGWPLASSGGAMSASRSRSSALVAGVRDRDAGLAVV